MSSESAVTVHWVRHARVDSHRGDVPATGEGLRKAREAGRGLSQRFVPGETVYTLTTQTRRSRDTASYMWTGMLEGIEQLGHRVDLQVPREEPAIRNPDLYVAGQRVEMVSTPEALAEQLQHMTVGRIQTVPFFPEFFVHADRVGFWLTHTDPPGEDSRAVGRRMMSFAVSLSDIDGPALRRYVCVTHSPLLRAFLRCYAGIDDPGEPEFMESIDLEVRPDREVVVRFREHERTLRPGIL